MSQFNVSCTHYTEQIELERMFLQSSSRARDKKQHMQGLQGLGLTQGVGQEVEDPCSNPDPTRHMVMSCSWEANNVNMQHSVHTAIN